MTKLASLKGVHKTAAAIDDLLRQAASAIESGRPQDAERMARDVLSKHAQNPGAGQLLGIALLAQQRGEEAVAPLEQSAREQPGATVETYLAMALRAAGRSNEALPVLERAVTRQPPSAHAFHELGLLHYLEGRLDQAQAVLQRGLELFAGAEFSLTLGAIFIDRGDAEGAKLAFARALANAPSHPNALHGSASALMVSGEFQRASERFRQILAQNPQDTRARLLLACCLLELGRFDEATGIMRSVTREAPAAYGKVLKAYVDVGRGRLWLKPSAAAAFLRSEKS
jgi:tetratricopeptide (TPR) repeat protein